MPGGEKGSMLIIIIFPLADSAVFIPSKDIDMNIESKLYQTKIKVLLF